LVSRRFDGGCADNRICLCGVSLSHAKRDSLNDGNQVLNQDNDGSSNGHYEHNKCGCQERDFDRIDELHLPNPPHDGPVYYEYLCLQLHDRRDNSDGGNSDQCLGLHFLNIRDHHVHYDDGSTRDGNGSLRDHPCTSDDLNVHEHSFHHKFHDDYLLGHEQPDSYHY
jgi:hypothetical protein